jgi:hypothetical protein
MLRFRSLSLVERYHLKRIPRKRVLSKYLLKLETTILDELMHPIPKLLVGGQHSQNLIFRVNNSNSEANTWIRVRMFARILKTRGQCRWLCFLLFSPIQGRAYDLTRNKLLFIILFNWKKFSKEVLSCLSMSDETTQGFNRVSLSQYSHPQGANDFDMKSTYVLESEYNIRLVYKGRGNRATSYTLAKIIFWNSNYALKLIQQSSHLKNSSHLEEFLKNFPDFLQLLGSREELEVVIHPESAKTLDQRFADSRQESPDVISDVEIWHQRFIIKDKNLLLTDSTCSPQLDFVAGHWQFLEQNNLNANKAFLVKPKSANRISLDKAILLMGRVDENWYHLLLDTLPRYLQFQALDFHIPVLVRADLPKSSINFLRKVLTREIIFVQPEDLISVKLLYFVAGRSTVYDSVTKNDDLRVAFSPLSLAKTRALVLRRLDLSTTNENTNKIYLIRDSRNRNLVNQKAISSKFKESGYLVLKSDEKFFLNQFQYFAEAQHVVSPGGAPLANIIFMSPGSRVTSIRSWRGADLKLWKKLAEARHIEFDEIIGIPTYFGRDSLAREHSNFYVPIKWIRRFTKY